MTKEREALAQPVQELRSLDEAFEAWYDSIWGGGKNEQNAAPHPQQCQPHPPLPVQPEQEPMTFDAFLNSKDFYELMQTYRHFQIDAFKQFEAVKDALRAAHNIGGK